MTYETCLKRLEIAKKYNNQKEIAFWQARAAKKAPKTETVTGNQNGKKSKR